MKQKKRKNIVRMPRRPALFWDVDPKTIDPKKHARYIIERILDFGTPQEIRWLFSYYPQRRMRDVMDLPRSVVNQKSKALWSLLFR